MLHTENQEKKELLELYIHVPFCIKKCNYCDFLSAPGDDETKAAYMKALCKEIADKSKDYQAYMVRSVFIGGGTPTAVPADWIKRVMETVRLYFQLWEEAEITMEMNPGTVNLTDLQVYYEAGINRLSIGVQSTEDKELAVLGRVHNFEQFVEAYGWARQVGFENINVDIMSALPEQTLESYQKTLERITALEPPPEHISAYSLIVEEGTPFYELFERGELNLPKEETERSMYELTGSFLQRFGYERYEISNYARSGRECIHNLGYWERVNYLGFGIGAASMIQNERFQNGTDLQKYLLEPCNAIESQQQLSVIEQIEETMFLGLRMMKGVSVKEFGEKFGISLMQIYGEIIEKHMKDGLLEQKVDAEGQIFVALTSKGVDVSNYVMADFLEPDFF